MMASSRDTEDSVNTLDKFVDSVLVNTSKIQNNLGTLSSFISMQQKKISDQLPAKCKTNWT